MRPRPSEYLLAYISCGESARTRAAGMHTFASTRQLRSAKVLQRWATAAVAPSAATAMSMSVPTMLTQEAVGRESSADAGPTAETSTANESDLSSDEDDLADTDGEDIDSDDLDDEMVLGVNDSGYQELAQQNDFVQLLGEA
ncbi:MAG: hypothetical protein Q9168_005924 [Polycauliona sp. 1 TL-2023]